ncbi:abortive infection system antitoxin AbiGi family protein [Methanimicrococcus blatticola]|uniref:Abortive phage resistance protein AbiGi (Putative antitoxin) n=1 Tax=Methanimicrococcus blatticola TaxID=91560 RepID=A0A484F6F9_9EURY|nr:abortive infection system antitoxin AbiGi family protein [Methanimicrococcus blatticola]MBZ3935192.1 hypothetical protein [Methanimicrococcus blatticola]MCC2508711.1 hypothetical protein [Methanimicrococcus blatticola]TDQ71254.1 abortive phage resistance protein AbiGi (putative antitoxin) [Methanimicrococcus blatticola]
MESFEENEYTPESILEFEEIEIDVLPAKSISEDYTQSANSLFHFMKKEKYLKDALSNKALIPRYCKENITYLNIQQNKVIFDEIAVLQKCFCDIHLHKLSTNFELILTKESESKLDEKEILGLSKNNSHPDYYGNFAIGFFKGWCENHNLQPIHYLNEKSNYTKNLSKVTSGILSSANATKRTTHDTLYRLALTKPLRGEMKRLYEQNGNNIELTVLKNFHDEREWRYIPDQAKIDRLKKAREYKVESIIANPKLLKSENVNYFLDSQSANIEDKQNDELWLKFEYSDIRYLIVPNDQARLNLIEHILSIPDIYFSGKHGKNLLISKILNLNEIKKDW